MIKVNKFYTNKYRSKYISDIPTDSEMKKENNSNEESKNNESKTNEVKKEIPSEIPITKKRNFIVL
jgi:hypothetical protein